jgi:hypothetical protein
MSTQIANPQALV